MRILVIEDEPKTAEYLHQGLTESGYIVDCASTGADGLHLARQQAYDLVLLDVNLPEMHGWDVLELVCVRYDALECVLLPATLEIQMA